MKSFPRLCMLGCMLLLSGCWDRTEINDLAFITGSAFDRTKDGKYLLSVQLAVPQGKQGTGNGGPQKKFVVLSGTGKNASEAFEIIQKKSSRRLFTAHRSVIFIGESLGRQGIDDVLDVFAHDPRQRLKTYIMVVRGESGQAVLETKYPFEQVPIEAVKELEGLRTEMAVTLRDYFISASSPGISPVLGAIEAQRGSDDGNKQDSELFKLAGTAIFKGARIVGFLNGNETSGFLWATDRMRHGRITADLPDGKGNVGILLNRANRRIVANRKGDRLIVNLRLEGVGSLVENNSRLDISRPANLAAVRTALERSIEEQVRRVVEKLQKQYRTDSIGIGREIYRDHPKQWKRLMEDWDTEYAEAEVSVSVKLSIMGAGMAGPPLQYREQEIVK